MWFFGYAKQVPGMLPFASRPIEGILYFVTCFTYFYVIKSTFYDTQLLGSFQINGTGRLSSNCPAIIY